MNGSNSTINGPRISFPTSLAQSPATVAAAAPLVASIAPESLTSVISSSEAAAAAAPASSPSPSGLADGTKKSINSSSTDDEVLHKQRSMSNTDQNTNLIGSNKPTLTDDELLIQATRLNSKMVRIKDDDMSNDNGRIILRRATQFDDAPESNVFDDRIQSASTINDDRQFLKRNGRFDDQFNSRSKPIWNYFDHGINRPEQSSSFNQPWRSTNNNGFIGNGIGSARIRELPTQSDDYISQQFAKRLNGGGGGGSSSIRPSTLSPLISPFQSKVSKVSYYKIKKTINFINFP